MRIIDENGTEIESLDLELGRLEPEKLLVAHHEAVPEKELIEEEGEPIWQNPDDPLNALRPIVVLQEYAPAVPAWDEYEDVLRYVPYTQAELDEIASQKAAEEEARKKAEEEAEAAKMLAATRNAIVDAAPARLAGVESVQLDHDEALASLYESAAKAQLDTDEAIVTIYEMMNGAVQ